MKKLLALLLALLTLLSLAGCGERQALLPEEDVSEASVPAYNAEPEIPVDPVEARLDEIMAGLSTEEKVGQLFFVRMPIGTEVSDVSLYHLGGYIVFWSNIEDKTAEEITSLFSACQAEAKIPLFLGTDEEGGSVVRFSLNRNLRAASFSSPRSLYAGGGMDALAENCAEKDAFLRQFGVNVNLAPVADCTSDQSAFIYSRTVGNSPSETADCIDTMVRQMVSDGMGCCLKHFPGYGNNVDTHTGVAVDERPYSQFVSEDFLPFQSGIAAGAPFVMVSHNIINCLDPDLPASLSPAVHNVLRDTLGFEGLIITDDLAMAAVAEYVENGSAAVQALLSGNDMIITTDYPTHIGQVLNAVESGVLPMDTVDTACRRVLRGKIELGLL